MQEEYSINNKPQEEKDPAKQILEKIKAEAKRCVDRNERKRIPDRLHLSPNDDYEARVFINATLKKEIESKIELLFNALMRGKEWNWEKGEFDPYQYCQHSEKQFCPTKQVKHFQLHIIEWYCWGDSLIDCKLQVINWFLHDRPYYPFIS